MSRPMDWALGALAGLAAGMIMSKYQAQAAMESGYELAKARYETPMSPHQLRDECVKWWFDGSPLQLEYARRHMCHEPQTKARAK